DKALPVQAYHKLLVWDIMKKPLATRVAEQAPVSRPARPSARHESAGQRGGGGEGDDVAPAAGRTRSE
ncbi:SAM-dependent methyltransferase, partial [Streptomyces sp. NPDC001002]